MEPKINTENIEKSYESFSKRLRIFKHRNLYDINNTTNNTANYIHKNYEQILQNEEILKETHSKITSKQQMIKDIFTYDFLFYSPDEKDKVSSIDELLNITKIELAKYQGIVGGYGIEDNQWLECGNRFELKNNQKGVFNTCLISLLKQADQLWFMKKLIKHMKKFANNTNLTIDFKLFSDEFNEIGWIVIVAELKQQEDKLQTLDDNFIYCNSDNSDNED